MESNHPDGSLNVPREAGSVVRFLKQITAIIAAFAALVTGITALVVAGKTSFSEVGPYFSNLIRHGKTEIPKTDTATPPPAQSIAPALISALEAEQHDDRDAARKALADAIMTASPVSVDALVEEVSQSNSYRKQLGLAVALGSVPGGWPSAAREKTTVTLLVMRNRSRDLTLRAALGRAAATVRR